MVAGLGFGLEMPPLTGADRRSSPPTLIFANIFVAALVALAIAAPACATSLLAQSRPSCRRGRRPAGPVGLVSPRRRPVRQSRCSPALAFVVARRGMIGFGPGTGGTIWRPELVARAAGGQSGRRHSLRKPSRQSAQFHADGRFPSSQPFFVDADADAFDLHRRPRSRGARGLDETSAATTGRWRNAPAAHPAIIRLSWRRSFSDSRSGGIGHAGRCLFAGALGAGLARWRGLPCCMRAPAA